MVLDKRYNLQSLDDLGKVNSDIIDSIKISISLDDIVEYNIKLVISELVINGFKHGNHSENELLLTVSLDEYDKLIITVDDGGSGFDTSYHSDYTDVDKECGRGLILVRAFTDDIRYNDKGNKVEVTIKL